MTPIWWRRRSKSAVATTGSPRTSPHSANPRFDVEDDSAALIAGVGDSYDNALAETINGLYKAEIIHRRGPWVIGSRRVRDAGMGGLVQQPTALGAHRQHPAGRSRGTLLRHAGTTCHGSVTQTKWPPTNPGRFIGLYVEFPAHAVVLAVDEKSQIQALDRTQPACRRSAFQQQSGSLLC